MSNKKKIIYYLLIACIIGMSGSLAANAGTGEDKYYEAVECYQDLLETSGKLKYRENWFPCIEKFRNAHTQEPSGPYAAASLFMAGKLYQDLYKRSAKGSDRASALDYFRRVLKRFSKSNYRPKAEAGIQALSQKSAKRTDTQKHTSPKANHLEKKKRGHVYEKSKAAYKTSKNRASDIKDDSHSAEKSSKKYAKSFEEIFKPTANGDATTINGLRFWSNPSYTRVVIDADRETSYTHKLLGKDPSARKPHRLYIDFDNSRLGKNIEKDFPINDNLLTRARAGRQPSGSVRVVMDIKSFKTYKIFSLGNPFRTIIDVWGGDASSKSNGHLVASTEPTRGRTTAIRQKEAKAAEPPKRKQRAVEKSLNVKASNIAKSLALGVRRIVIDPGHGGHDGGAVGYDKRVYEKNVVLSIAKRLARKIRQRLGCEVIMTRTSDRFLSLEERTAIANTKNADLFISIHTNAHKDRRANGIETYFLNLATDEDAIRVAARENATTRKNISDLQRILNDLMQNAKINESSRLAAYVQRSLYNNIKSKYNKVKNKGVKQAPFYVLLGAQMPSILVETSFISNKRECKRLTDPTYQDHLCEAILKGVRKYIQETSPTALWRLDPKSSG